MNMFATNRARARTAASAARNVVVPIRPIVAASPSRGAFRGPIRASWTIDPASGRLHCRWVAEDEATDGPGLRRSPEDVGRPRVDLPELLAA
jgi:hypothetical protein